MNTAAQCRERGLKVGDTIEGRSEGPGSWWDEVQLTLLYLGEKIAVWNERYRHADAPRWGEPRESATWVLDYRQWRKVKP